MAKKKLKIKSKLKKPLSSQWEIIEDDIPIAQTGISLDEFRPKFANSNEQIITDLKTKSKIDSKGTQSNPINLKPVEITAVRNKPLGFAGQSLKSQQTNPANVPASQVAGSIFSFIPEAFHTPSRVVNYGIGAYKNKDLRFNPYQSEISETLGWQNNDPSDLWASTRNFFIDNATDFLVPAEGIGNIGSKVIPEIGNVAKTGLREGVDLVHPVGRRLKQIEQEGISQGLSAQAIKNRQMQEVGITSLQREGYFPGVSEVLSEYLVPYSYDNAKKRLLNIPKKIIKGDTNTKRLADLDKVILDQGENTLSKPRYDAWRMYSGLPQRHGTFRIAETTPINHPSYTQNQLNNLEKFSLNDEKRLLSQLPNEYDYFRFVYNDEDLLNNVNYLKEQLKDINTLQQKGIDFPQSDFTTTNVMGGYNRRFFNNKMEYNDTWDLDLNGLKVDKYFGKPFMSHGQLEYSFEPAKKTINTLLRRADKLEQNINPFKGKTKYNFDDIKLKNYINTNPTDFATPKKQTGGKIKTDPKGYWNKDNHGKPVRIPSNRITMKGVNQPLLGISDTGDIQMMSPGMEYSFDGNSVTEFPVTMQQGGQVRQPIKGTKEQYQAYQDSLDLYTTNRDRLAQLERESRYATDMFGQSGLYNNGLLSEHYTYLPPHQVTHNQYPLTNVPSNYENGNDRTYWGFGNRRSDVSINPITYHGFDRRFRHNVIRGTNQTVNLPGENDLHEYAGIWQFPQPVQPIIYQPEDRFAGQIMVDSPNNPPANGIGFRRQISQLPRPKEQPINIQSFKPDLLQGNNQQLEFNPTGFQKGSYFTRPRQSQEIGDKLEYFDKKTGHKLMGEGGKFTDPRQDSYYTPSSSDRKIPFVQGNTKGKDFNPIQLPEAQIIAKKGEGYRNVMRHPTDIGSSADLASALFAAPIGEAFHTPSRLINQGIRLGQGKGLGNYDSEISQTLGLQNNDPTDLWTGVRNFAINNVADFIVPTDIPTRGVNTLENAAFKTGEYVESANKTKNIIQGYRQQLNPKFINPQEQEMLHTVRNIGMSMKGEDDIWKASTISNVLDRAKSLSDEQFKTLTGFEKSELSQRLEGLNNGTLKRPEEQLVDGLTRQEYTRQYLNSVRNRRPRTTESRQELQDLSHRLEDPPYDEVYIPTEGQSFYSNNREAFQSQNPQGWQTINTQAVDLDIDRFNNSYNINQLLGTRFDNFLYKNEPNIIDKFNDKLGKYLSNKQGFMEKAENSGDIQQLVPGLYASQGEKEVKRKLFGAIKTLENAPKGSQFIPAHSLSSDSYPLSYRILPRFLEQGKVDLSFHGMQDFNSLGFSGKVGISPEVNVKEINSVIKDLNQKLDKKIPYARIKDGQIKAPIISATRKKFGGNITSDWEIVQDDNDWELV